MIEVRLSPTTKKKMVTMTGRNRLPLLLAEDVFGDVDTNEVQRDLGDVLHAARHDLRTPHGEDEERLRPAADIRRRG